MDQFWKKLNNFSLKACDAFEVPPSQRVAVIHVVFNGDALSYFTDHILFPAFVDEAFKAFQDHLLIPVHQDTYITEWNTLRYSEFRVNLSDEPSSESLEFLFKRTKDVKSLLDEAYQSPLLSRH